MHIIADLQLHSKYSRAVSQKMDLFEIYRWARRKGIGLIATGDWTHPLWFREIQAHLEEDGSGLLRLKKSGLSALMGAEKDDKLHKDQKGNEPLFLLATEISSIYSQGGSLRRIHNLVWAPTLKTVEKINRALIKQGAKLTSDGRPIVGLSSIDICEIVFSIDKSCLIIPAHIWTPWFSLYGSQSGFDSIEECFGSYAKYIYAIETGLSSDPAMNWRIKELDSRTIISSSDAHSGPKLGREATVFQLKKHANDETRKAKITYKDVSEAIKVENDAKWKISYTIEFYPEEGKYHYSGHRKCEVRHSPTDTAKFGNICPVCGKHLTIGVIHRVDKLAGRTEEELKMCQFEIMDGVKAYSSKAFSHRPPYVMLVPLQEILAEALGSRVGTKKVVLEYQKLIDVFGSEFNLLLYIPTKDIVKISGPRVAKAIDKVRQGDIAVEPGYDGVFGVVKIWGEKKEKMIEKKQMSLF